jgi:D-amino-acid dehydrogenase
MKVVIIGAGVIGLTSAFFLKQRGHDVTVIERDAGPGLETSFANGALLTPSMAEPWNAPGCWRVLLASLGRSDAAMQLRWRALPSLAGWGVALLRNSVAARFERGTLSNLRLALRSLAAMELIREQTGIEYGRVARGSLRVFRDAGVFARATAVARERSAHGLVSRALSPAEVVEVEPGLGSIASQLAGALHYPGDETGDAYRFCVALAEHARRQGVMFRFGTDVSALEVRHGQVVAAVTDQERLVADRYVVAAGSYSTPLLRRAGVHVPVRPVKGYSVTFNHDARLLLNLPVADDHLHAGIVPLEGAIRVVGTAEFAGFDRTLNPARIQNLLGLLRQILPDAQLDFATATSWCGLRAVSADGVPIIGGTSLSNLMVNTGHGHLGWTMAAGSAQLLADLMTGEPAFIDPNPFSFSRFGGG